MLSAAWLTQPHSLLTQTQIYAQLLVARLSPADSREHARLVADTSGPSFHRHAQVQRFELEKLAVAPGTTLDGRGGFPALLAARGLLSVNNQIHDEASTVLYSQNTFLLAVHDIDLFAPTSQLFSHRASPTYLPKIQHVILLALESVVAEHPRRARAVALMHQNLFGVVTNLNSLGVTLKSFRIQFVSCYEGEIERTRRNIDALLTHPRAAPVMVRRGDGRIDTFKADNLRTFLANAFAIGDVFEDLHTGVDTFEVYGDFPTTVIEQLERKFGAASPESKAIRESVEVTGIYGRGVNNETGQNADTTAAFMRQMAARDPGNEFVADMARRMSNRPMYSPAVQAMLFGPPTLEEIARMGGRRAPGGGRGRGRGRM